ncbi:MAG: hypothetical protein M5U34_12500 [Chloroflexi bacterium]|nr:hypothetical protein [Chloroflexota bacterium]
MLMQRGLLTDPNDPRNKILQGRDVGLLADQGRNPDNKQNIYRFPHRSFQEYLAGLHFLNDKDYPQAVAPGGRERPATVA